NKRKTVRNFSRNDFLSIKQDLSKCRDQLADFIGLQDPTYDNIFNRGGQKGQVEAALSDIDLMALIQSQIEAVNFILANLFAVDAVIDPFALAKANANNPEVDIGQYG